MTSRRGFSLYELLVVVTVVTVIMAATVVLMHFVLQMNTEVHQRTQTVTTVGRLADQFRRDAHMARGEPLLATDHRTVELHLPGGTIVKWRIEEQRTLVRTEQARGSGDHGAGSVPANREDSFTLPKGTTAALELQPQATARILTLRIESPGSSGPSLAIEALAARDGRLAVEEEKP
jgi:prepilin-type N-terminal cleavage/methylation domain-containing protein